MRSPVERYLPVTMAPFKVSILSNFGTAVILFDWASAATCTNASRYFGPSAGTMCKADLPRARSNERAENRRHRQRPRLAAAGRGSKPLTMHCETDPGQEPGRAG